MSARDFAVTTNDPIVELSPSSLCDIPASGGDSGSRILIYSHDTYGLGHFRRCLKIAHETRKLAPNASVLLLTGSPLAHQFAVPDGVDFVKLPSVIKTGNEEYRSRTLRTSIHDLVAMRSRIIRETALAFHPDVVLVDHAPLGLKNEALPALESLHEQSSRPAMVLGLRDIIDEPARVIDAWIRSGMFGMIDRLFDQVVIYGQRSVYDTCDEYAFPSSVTAKTSYSGYISGSQCTYDPDHVAAKGPRPTVVVTVGGGEDGGQIVESYIAMIRSHLDEVWFDSIILAGPLLTEERVSEIRQIASELPIDIHHFVADVTSLLARSDLVISMGGYNAVAEILACANRAMLIPREWPRQEQLIRAQRLTALGYVDMIRTGGLTPESLWSHVHRAMSTADQPLARMREKGEISLTGASFMAGALLKSIRLQQNRESSK